MQAEDLSTQTSNRRDPSVLGAGTNGTPRSEYQETELSVRDRVKTIEILDTGGDLPLMSNQVRTQKEDFHANVKVRTPSRHSIKLLPAALLSFALGSASHGLAWKQFLIIEEIDKEIAESVSYVFAIIGVVFWISYLPKGFLEPRATVEDVLHHASHPAISSGFMALGNFSAVLFDFSVSVSEHLWMAGIFCHLALMSVYSIARITKREPFKAIFYPYCFVSTVGVSAFAATAGPLQNQKSLAEFAFWTGFAWLCLLYVPVMIRLFRYELEPKPKTPTIGILIAPINLVLSGKLAIIPDEYSWINHFLFYWGIATLLYGVTKIFIVLRPPFLPTHAALTFPTNITTIAFLRYHIWTDSRIVLVFATGLLTISTIINLTVLTLGLHRLLTGRLTRQTPAPSVTDATKMP